jgi:hypothetical protein
MDIKANFEANNFAQRFADDLVAYHKADLESGDLELRDAVVVKMMALSALAYDLEIGDEPFDLEDVLLKLRAALIVLEEKRASGGERAIREPQVEPG